MQQGIIRYNTRLLWFIAALLCCCIVAYECTGLYYVVAVPLLLEFILITLHDWKKAYWILLFTIPFSMQFSMDKYNLSISIPDEPLVWVFFILSFLIIASGRYHLRAQWLVNPVTVIILLQFIWLVVAVIYSEVMLFSIKFLLAKTWYLTVFFLLPLWIFTDKKDFIKCFRILLIPMLATMIIILLHHATYGFRFASIGKVAGTFYYNHVEYSAVMSMFFPLLLSAYSINNTANKKTAMITALICFFLVAIFLAYARAAMVAVVFACFIGFAIKKRKVNFIIPSFYLIIVAVVFYLSSNNNYLEYRPSYENTYMHHNFSDHIMATFKGRDESSMERFHRWIAAVKMSNEKPYTGFGPHSFYYFYKPYTVSMFRTYSSDNPEHSTTHNYFLLMLAEQGIPAMLLYGVLIIVVFAQAQKTYHRFSDPFYKSCTLGVAMLFAAGFVNNFFSEMVETHKVGALFYLSLSALVILTQKSKERAEASFTLS